MAVKERIRRKLPSGRQEGYHDSPRRCCRFELGDYRLSRAPEHNQCAGKTERHLSGPLSVRHVCASILDNRCDIVVDHAFPSPHSLFNLQTRRKSQPSRTCCGIVDSRPWNSNHDHALWLSSSEQDDSSQSIRRIHSRACPRCGNYKMGLSSVNKQDFSNQQT